MISNLKLTIKSRNQGQSKLAQEFLNQIKDTGKRLHMYVKINLKFFKYGTI